MPHTHRSQKLAFLPAFVILFFFYQIPEGLGIHLLQSPGIQAGLLLLFYPVAYLAGRGLGYKGLSAYAMELHRGWYQNLLFPLLLALLLKSLALYLGHCWGVYQIAPNEAAYSASHLTLSFLTVLFTTWFPSVAEDIVTRGVWYRNTALAHRKTVFVLLTAAIYVLNHIYRLSNGPLEWVMLFCFGVAYGTALVRSGSLWTAIGLHWGWNIAGSFADAALTVEVAGKQLAPILSTGTHLVMAGLVLLLTPWLKGRKPKQVNRSQAVL